MSDGATTSCKDSRGTIFLLHVKLPHVSHRRRSCAQGGSPSSTDIGLSGDLGRIPGSLPRAVRTPPGSSLPGLRWNFARASSGAVRSAWGKPARPPHPPFPVPRSPTGAQSSPVLVVTTSPVPHRRSLWNPAAGQADLQVSPNLLRGFRPPRSIPSALGAAAVCRDVLASRCIRVAVHESHTEAATAGPSLWMTAGLVTEVLARSIRAVRYASALNWDDVWGEGGSGQARRSCRDDAAIPWASATGA